MHKLAVVFFYTCAALSITFTALVFLGIRVGLVRDPEKWAPVFGKDHAQTKS